MIPFLFPFSRGLLFPLVALDKIYIYIYNRYFFPSQFIYRFIDSTWTLPHKIEEEIPRLMRSLRYPGQISKSTFISGKHKPFILMCIVSFAFKFICYIVFNCKLLDLLYLYVTLFAFGGTIFIVNFEGRHLSFI